MSSLFVKGSGSVYKQTQDTQLRAELANIDRFTLVLEAADWTELRLGPNGELKDGFRYTQTGLQQICSLLAPGLFRLLMDLAGASRNIYDPIADFSLAEATTIFNTLLARRFSQRFDDRVRIIRNLQRKTIDGVVGAKYVMLDNSTFFERTTEALSQIDRKAIFYEASLAGRRLSLRFVDRIGLLRSPDNHVYYSGLWFCNSEIGGEAPVCGSSLICSPTDNCYALGPVFGGRRIIHAGRDFTKRLEILVAVAFDEQLVRADIQAGFNRLASTRVELPKESKEREKKIILVANKLARKNVPINVAKKAIINAIYSGELDDQLPSLPDNRGKNDFCYLDLFNSLTTLAKTRHPALRERMERAAFSLLQSSKSNA